MKKFLIPVAAFVAGMVMAAPGMVGASIRVAKDGYGRLE